MPTDLQLFIRRTKIGETPEKDNVVKETMRYISQYFYDKQQESIFFLTLPSAFWRFEINMKNHISGLYGGKSLNPPYLRFVGCEREWEIFQLASINIPRVRIIKNKRSEELNCSITSNDYSHILYHVDIFDYLKVSQYQYDVIWLDLTVAITHVANKLHCLKNSIKQGSIVILTLMKAREHLKMPLEREQYIDSIMLPLGLEKVDTFTYRDMTPMIHIIYKQSYVNSQNL